MANENDASRDKKLLVGLIALVCAGAAGGGYLVWNHFFAPPPTPSRINVTNVTSAGKHQSTETEQYRQLLHEYNREGASAARADNSSFIASIPVGGVPRCIPWKPPKEKKRKPAHEEKQKEKKKDEGLSKSDQAALNKLLASMDTSAQSPDLQQVSLAVATERERPPKAVRPNRLTLTGHRPSCPGQPAGDYPAGGKHGPDH
jgi:intracellular multiplication protein IcmE